MKYLVIFELAYTVFSGLLMDVGMTRQVLYLLDAVNAALLIGLILSPEKKRLRPVKHVLWAMGLWLGYMIVSTLFKGPDLKMILLSTRNWARGFVLFCACFVFLEKRDVDWVLGVMDLALIFHFALICVEFLFFGKRDDTLGGIFGCQMGCNAPNIIYLTFMVIRTLCRCMEEDRVKPFSVFVLFSSMIIAALAELKIFYYIFPAVTALVILLYALRHRAKRRTVLWTVLLVVAAWAVGAVIMYLIYPRRFLFIIGKRSIAEYERISRWPYMFGRTHFISEISDYFFDGSPSLLLTGFGFGNCAVGSDYYTTNSAYYLFSNQLLLMEGGLVGLALFTAIPMVSCIEHGSALFRGGATAPRVLGCVFALMMTLILFYNNSFHEEPSYLIFFLMTVSYFLVYESKAGGAEEGKAHGLSH